MAPDDPELVGWQHHLQQLTHVAHITPLAADQWHQAKDAAKPQMQQLREELEALREWPVLMWTRVEGQAGASVTGAPKFDVGLWINGEMVCGLKDKRVEGSFAVGLDHVFR